MTKLTDTQLMVLLKAVAREDGVGVVAPRMTKALSANYRCKVLAFGLIV